MTNSQPLKKFKYTEIILATYITIILATVCLANRFTQIGVFVVPGGLPLFPVTFLLMLAVGEVYGFSYARRQIWIGFFASLLFAIEVTTISYLEAPAFFSSKEAYFVFLLKSLPERLK